MGEFEACSQNLFGEDERLGLVSNHGRPGYDYHLLTSTLPMTQPGQPDTDDLLGLQFYDDDFELSPGFMQSIDTGENVGSGFSQVLIKEEEEERRSAGTTGVSFDAIGIPNDEIITFDNWEGVHNFKVFPFMDQRKVSSKRALFSEQHNKLFCQTDTSVPFKFLMDYKNIKNPENLMVRVFLAYEDNDAVGQAVLRCSTHKEQEKNLTDEAQKPRIDHMLRPANPIADMQYYKHPASSRCYVLVPLKFPEPGTTFATRSFLFTCRNSCSVLQVDGKSRRAISLLFWLFDQQTGMVLGRSFTHVRVCSAPARDYNKEINPTTPIVVKKRKINEPETGSLPNPKQVRFGQGNQEISLNSIELNGNNQLPGTPENVVRSVVRASTRGRLEEDGVSSSQETVYSCDETDHRIQLRDFVGDVRWALKQKKSPNPILRSYSNNVFAGIKLIQNMIGSAREVDEDSRRKEQEEKSPDGGFHDFAQDQ